MGIILVCDYGGRLQVINDNDFSHNLPHILLSICKVSITKGTYNLNLKVKYYPTKVVSLKV